MSEMVSPKFRVLSGALPTATATTRSTAATTESLGNKRLSASSTETAAAASRSAASNSRRRRTVSGGGTTNKRRSGSLLADFRIPRRRTNNNNSSQDTVGTSETTVHCSNAITTRQTKTRSRKIRFDEDDDDAENNAHQKKSSSHSQEENVFQPPITAADRSFLIPTGASTNSSNGGSGDDQDMDPHLDTQQTTRRISVESIQPLGRVIVLGHNETNVPAEQTVGDLSLLQVVGDSSSSISTAATTAKETEESEDVVMEEGEAIREDDQDDSWEHLREDPKLPVSSLQQLNERTSLLATAEAVRPTKKDKPSASLSEQQDVREADEIDSVETAQDVSAALPPTVPPAVKDKPTTSSSEQQDVGEADEIDGVETAQDVSAALPPTVPPAVKDKPTTSPSSSEQQDVGDADDIDGDETLQDASAALPPTTEALKYHCWKCGVSFREENGGFCFYVMHVHPILEVPVCFVCSRQVVAAQQETDTATTSTAKINDEDEENHDCCLGCGDDEEDVDVFFCCDTCPAKFCDTCVAKAHGGGKEGVDYTRALQDSDAVWSCPRCQPPAPLLELRFHLCDVSNNTSAQQQQQPMPRRTAKQVSDEYLEVERERDLVDWYLSLEGIANKKAEMEKEIWSKIFSERPLRYASVKEQRQQVDKDIATELEIWEQQLQDHDARLTDMATTLQDELTAMNEPIPYYAASTTVFEDSGMVEPPWKRAADLECEKRQAMSRADARNDTKPMYRDEIWDDTEDLNTSDMEDDTRVDDMERAQWRVSGKVQKEDVEYATRCEDELLQAQHITVRRRVVTDQQDVERLQEEEQQQSTMGSSGVSRVRRDDYQRWRRKTSKQQTEKPTTIQQETRTASQTEGSDRDDQTSEDPMATDVISKPPKRFRMTKTPEPSRSSRAVKRKIESDHEEEEESSLCHSPKRCRTEPDGFDLEAPISSPESKPHDVSLANAPKRKVPTKTREQKPRRSTASGRSCNSPVMVDDSPRFSQMDDDDEIPATHGIFSASPFVLTPTVSSNSGEKTNLPTVCIAEPLTRILKPHQWEGIQFMWKNTFSDLIMKDGENKGDKGGGCILAHNMGLGKTLSCISILHCVLNHPAIFVNSSSGKHRAIHTVLLVVPVNVLSNWEAEFEKWTEDLRPSVRVANVSGIDKDGRCRVIQNWYKKGGALLISEKLFIKLVKLLPTCLLSPGPDVIVVDEAHGMVKNADTEICKALSKVETKRRIALTGSPIQNNLMEYYRMVSWVRPGLLGSESAFESKYISPIVSGLPSDASQEAKHLSDETSRQLHGMLEPYVHRKDASVLKDEVPFMQQVVLHIRPSKLQTQLYGAAKRFPDKNFFRLFQALKPVHNHPGCLLMTPSGQSSKSLSSGNQVEAKDDDLKEPPVNGKESNSNRDGPIDANGTNADENQGVPIDAQPDNPNLRCIEVEKAQGRPPPISDNEVEMWWTKIAKRHGMEKMKDINNGYKIVLFLHVLVLAQRKGEKVMLFTKCLKTLDFIEEVLNLDDWGSHVESLRAELGEEVMGGWHKNVDYLRIDGQVSSSERGDLVTRFNDENRPAGEAKLFLISKAGGLGVNLVAASRVVLFDCDFNPTVNIQALFRCYRYGQAKPVFAYMFLTEGSMEEKIYSRCISKTGVALRVIDRKTIGRAFTAREMDDMTETDLWAQCDRCLRWRMLSPENKAEDLPDEWFCEMNEKDSINNNCHASEKTKDWYYRRGFSIGAIASPQNAIANETTVDDIKKDLLVDRDTILQRLLTISADTTGKQSPSRNCKSQSNKGKSTVSKGKSLLVSKYFYQETLLEEIAKADSDGVTAAVPGIAAKDAVDPVLKSKVQSTSNPNTEIQAETKTTNSLEKKDPMGSKANPPLPSLRKSNSASVKTSERNSQRSPPARTNDKPAQQAATRPTASKNATSELNSQRPPPAKTNEEFAKQAVTIRPTASKNASPSISSNKSKLAKRDKPTATTEFSMNKKGNSSGGNNPSAGVVVKKEAMKVKKADKSIKSRSASKGAAIPSARRSLSYQATSSKRETTSASDVSDNGKSKKDEPYENARWKQCDHCLKWRMLPPDVNAEDLPDEWSCEMNEKDSINNNCNVSEKKKDWYVRNGCFAFDSFATSVTDGKGRTKKNDSHQRKDKASSAKNAERGTLAEETAAASTAVTTKKAVNYVVDLMDTDDEAEFYV